MNDDWISARLDGELTPEEAREFDAAVAADPALARTLDEVARVRARLREGAVEMPAGALARMIAAVEAADAPAAGAVAAPVVSLAARHRVPTFAAVAAAVLIIASVVGGLGGTASLPALGDFVAQHEAAAAAVVDGDTMPDEMDDMDSMPMDEASKAALPMPADYAMASAYAGHGTVHLVYRTGSGEPLSVFRREGDVDMSALGPGEWKSGDGVEMWSAPMDGVHVAVLDGVGYVWIMVGDEPPGDMMDDMMDDLPTRSPSLGDRCRDVADVVVEPFRLWD